MEKTDKADIENKTEALSSALQKIGEIIQKAANEEAKPGAEGKTDETVREAEVTKDEAENK